MMGGHIVSRLWYEIIWDGAARLAKGVCSVSFHTSRAVVLGTSLLCSTQYNTGHRIIALVLSNGEFMRSKVTSHSI